MIGDTCECMSETLNLVKFVQKAKQLAVQGSRSKLTRVLDDIEDTIDKIDSCDVYTKVMKQDIEKAIQSESVADIRELVNNIEKRLELNLRECSKLKRSFLSYAPEDEPEDEELHLAPSEELFMYTGSRGR